VHPLADVAGFDLSAFNRFRNPQADQAIDLAREPHAALSAPFHVARFDFRRPPPPERRRALEVTASAVGEAHAVAYWFELHLDDETTLSTAPGGDLDHWQQAVQFFDQGRNVVPGDLVPLVVGHSNARIFFEL